MPEIDCIWRSQGWRGKLGSLTTLNLLMAALLLYGHDSILVRRLHIFHIYRLNDCYRTC
jgi:hypothetical protein